MASRTEFLSLIRTRPDKSFINYFLTETVGLTVSFSDYEDTILKLYEFWSKIVEEGFQYVGMELTDFLWLPCLLLVVWKNGKACACIDTQYSEECNINFLDKLHVKYLISDRSESRPGSELFRTFQINGQHFYIWKRELPTEHKFLKTDSDICYGIMTSGSTGKPKIVQVPWACILINIYELISLLSVNGSDNFYLSSPYTFDPFFVELFIPLITGCSLTIVSHKLKMFTESLLNIFFKGKTYISKEINECGAGDGKFFCKTGNIVNTTVTVFQMTPSIFRRWGVNNIRDIILFDNSPLRILLLGGEKFPTDLFKLKSKNNSTRIFNIYGITEISCWAFINEVLECCEEISLGRPLSGITYKIDENNELHLGSRERKCIVGDENIQEDEVLYRRTGDIVNVKEGSIYYVSRSNQIVKKFGIKVNLERIETFFSNIFKTGECYCIFDEDTMKIAVFYQNSNIIHDFVLVTKEKDFPYSGMSSIEVPDHVFEIKTIPLNSNGKCDRKSLLKLFKDVIKKRCGHIDIETTFRRLWQDFVGGNNFITDGGDSVKALQIITRLEDAGIEVSKDFLPHLLKNGDYNSCLMYLTKNFVVESHSKKRRLSGEGIYKLTVSWTYDTKKCIDASPTIFEYNRTAHAVVGSHSSRLSSVKIDTGQENWTINLGDRIESGFCVNKSSTFGVIGCYDHHVYSISVSTGKILWKYRTDGMVKSTPCFSTDEESVYVASYDTHLYRLNCEDGSLIKKIKLSERGIFSSGVTCHQLKTFYIATLDGTCICMCQESNDVKWKLKLEAPVFASPVLMDEHIIFTEVIGRLNCCKSKTGEKVWYYDSSGYIYSTPCHYPPSNYLIYGCYDSYLYCLELSEKPSPKWKAKLDSPVFGKPSLYKNEFIAVATIKGYVYLHWLVSGVGMVQTKLNGEIFSSPKIYLDNLLVGCRDNNLYSMKILTS